MKTLLAVAFLLTGLIATPAGTNSNSRLLRPLALAEALDLALQQNGAIRKSQAGLEATYGVVVQTRAVALPKVGVNSSYSANEDSSTDQFRGSSATTTPGGGTVGVDFSKAIEFANQRWSADIRVTQSIYEGGRINSALRTAITGMQSERAGWRGSTTSRCPTRDDD